ncbi:hypothetical protein SAMN05216299_103197 [Nitrosospira sp. Nsp14]|nr:hypothetical protein SAMN05216299_103197 [Nitrosospira sp. Nsp14]
MALNLGKAVASFRRKKVQNWEQLWLQYWWRRRECVCLALGRSSHPCASLRDRTRPIPARASKRAVLA